METHMEYHIYGVPYVSTFSLNMDFGEANKFRKPKELRVAGYIRFTATTE